MSRNKIVKVIDRMSHVCDAHFEFTYDGGPILVNLVDENGVRYAHLDIAEAKHGLMRSIVKGTYNPVTGHYMLRLGVEGYTDVSQYEDPPKDAIELLDRSDLMKGEGGEAKPLHFTNLIQRDSQPMGSRVMAGKEDG